MQKVIFKKQNKKQPHYYKAMYDIHFFSQLHTEYFKEKITIETTYTANVFIVLFTIAGRY